MRQSLQWMFWVVGLFLQSMVIVALLRSGIRQYAIVLAYCSCLIVTTVADILLIHLLGFKNPIYVTYFWLAELTRQTGIFSVVISLVMFALPENRQRRWLVPGVVCTSVLLWMASLVIHQSPSLNVWMTPVTRDLSVTSAVVNLFLWFALISNRNRSPELLLLAGGLGLQMTGDAIGQSLRSLRTGPILFWIGNLMIPLTHFLCLAIWYQAFSKHSVAVQERRRMPPLEHSAM